MTDNGTEQKTKDLLPDNLTVESTGSLGFFNYAAEAGLNLPIWWSQQRDVELRNFWKKSDHLSGAVNAIGEIVTTIPYKVIPYDKTIKAHLKAAQNYQFSLDNLSVSRGNLLETGWVAFSSPFAQDYHTQDNGAIGFIEGKGIKLENPYGQMTDGPLKAGEMAHLIHLDSARCWRTNYKEWPIWYTDNDGAMYFIHHTRLINLTSMSSPIAGMLGVGFCGVSRCPGIVQNLIDIITFKQEKLGSRPARGILVIDGGGEREAKSLGNKIKATEEINDNLGLSRYSKMPVLGLKNGGSISLLDLNSVPDGFDELTATQLGITVIALAFGVDVRTLSFAIGVAGQTKADAEVQNMKTHGKGPATFIRRLKQQIEARFLPPYLRIEFDFQDDTQDEFNATIRLKRSERREKDLTSGVTDIRIERQQMIESGEITEAQFIELELSSGRLEDGRKIELLLFSADKDIQLLLGDIDANSTIDKINAQIEIVAQQLNSGVQNKARQVLALLTKMQQADEDEEIEVEEIEEDVEVEEIKDKDESNRVI